MSLPPAAVSAVFLTHVHADPIADLGALMLQRWADAVVAGVRTVMRIPAADRRGETLH